MTQPRVQREIEKKILFFLTHATFAVTCLILYEEVIIELIIEHKLSQKKIVYAAKFQENKHLLQF